MGLVQAVMHRRLSRFLLAALLSLYSPVLSTAALEAVSHLSQDTNLACVLSHIQESNWQCSCRRPEKSAAPLLYRSVDGMSVPVQAKHPPRKKQP